MNNHIELVLQPPRSYNQKKRFAANMRSRHISAKDIKKVLWHPENSPHKMKHHYGIMPTSQFSRHSGRSL